MSETIPTPCPQRSLCPCPPSAACTATQFATCGMVNTPEYIATLLQRPYYLRMSASERAAFLTEHFHVFIDTDEATYSATRIADIIKARINITRHAP